jgi:hypothetical protein
MHGAAPERTIPFGRDHHGHFYVFNFFFEPSKSFLLLVLIHVFSV